MTYSTPIADTDRSSQFEMKVAKTCIALNLGTDWCRWNHLRIELLMSKLSSSRVLAHEDFDIFKSYQRQSLVRAAHMLMWAGYYFRGERERDVSSQLLV